MAEDNVDATHLPTSMQEVERDLRAHLKTIKLDYINLGERLSDEQFAKLAGIAVAACERVRGRQDKAPQAEPEKSAAPSKK